MQRNDLPRIGVLSADAAAIAQFLRRIQALDAETAALLPLSPAAVPDCEPYLCGASTHAPLQKLSEAAEILTASGCTVIAVPDSAGIFCAQLTAAAGIPVLSTADATMPQLVGALHQRVSILCTPGVRAANAYGLTAQRYGLQCSYPDAPVQALLGCVRPEKTCSLSKSLVEFRRRSGERKSNHFLRRHVRRRKYFSACKRARRPPPADSACSAVRQPTPLSKSNTF